VDSNGKTVLALTTTTNVLCFAFARARSFRRTLSRKHSAHPHGPLHGLRLYIPSSSPVLHEPRRLRSTMLSSILGFQRPSLQCPRNPSRLLLALPTFHISPAHSSSSVRRRVIPTRHTAARLTARRHMRSFPLPLADLRAFLPGRIHPRRPPHHTRNPLQVHEPIRICGAPPTEASERYGDFLQALRE
jgi:hypothetical protein